MAIADPNCVILARNCWKQRKRRRIPHHLARGRRPEHDRDSREGQDGTDMPCDLSVQVRHVLLPRSPPPSPPQSPVAWLTTRTLPLHPKTASAIALAHERSGTGTTPVSPTSRRGGGRAPTIRPSCPCYSALIPSTAPARPPPSSTRSRCGGRTCILPSCGTRRAKAWSTWAGRFGSPTRPRRSWSSARAGRRLSSGMPRGSRRSAEVSPSPLAPTSPCDEKADRSRIERLSENCQIFITYAGDVLGESWSQR